jgi:hypothetical protein
LSIRFHNLLQDFWDDDTIGVPFVGLMFVRVDGVCTYVIFDGAMRFASRLDLMLVDVVQTATAMFGVMLLRFHAVSSG